MADLEELHPDTVVLMHHPSSWLHEDDTSEWNGTGQGAYLYLASRVHLVLCGHTHEVAHMHSRAKGGGCVELSCGASFDNAAHPNTFQLVRFRPEHIEYRQFEWINRSTDQGWRSRDVRSPKFSDEATCTAMGDSGGHLLAELKRRLASYAFNYVIKKSHALAPTLTPKFQPLFVERRIKYKQANLVEQVERLTLESAVAESSRIVVWGDLGTGKSTLVGTMVERANREEDVIAVLLPAASLLPIPETPADLLMKISMFLHSTSFFDIQTFDIRDLIREQSSQIVLVFDGLDEIDNRSARGLLSVLEQLPGSLARVRIVATSRAVGNDYALSETWLEVTMSALQDRERLALLLNVASADGSRLEAANSLAEAFISMLRDDAVLDEAARSPMELRLLFQELSTATSHPRKSLGAMLYGLLLQRLLNWENADPAKQNPTPAFCGALRSAEARLEALSLIATAMLPDGYISATRANAILRTAPILAACSDAAKSEALHFFEWTNLIQLSADRVEFALRPLFEIACAAAVLSVSRSMPDIPETRWRVVAFAAAIAHLRGQLDDFRPAFLAYIHAHAKTVGWILPACYIAAESKDAALAQGVIALNHLPLQRPLFAFEKERRSSAASIAMTIHLAGDDGFRWFYQRYLDPRYPFLHHGSHLPETVFESWAILNWGQFSQEQLQLVGNIPSPHLDTKSSAQHRIVPIACLVNPLSVEIPTLAALVPHLLTHSLLASRAEIFIRELQSQHSDVVQNALWTHVQRANENSAKCAELWLARANAVELPAQLIYVALRARGYWNGRYFSQTLWDEVLHRLGQSRWDRFCRWQSAMESEADAIGAVLYLIGTEPAQAKDFREVLLKALHDGNHSDEAESRLVQLSDAEPEDFASWLSRRIAESVGALNSAHSGWWRIMLSLLPRLGTQGPLLLSKAIRGVGPFLLSRNSDIRRRIRELEGTPEANAYIEALETKLQRGTIRERHGAAQFLVCLGRDLGEALTVCARARLNLLNSTWEWDQYCLSLRFSAAAIDHVLAKKSSLATQARMFVLALAAADGRRLDREDVTFVISNLSWIHSLKPLEDLLADPMFFPSLLDNVLSADTSNITYSAQSLLNHHFARLDERARVYCEILAYDRVPLAYERFFREFVQDSSQRAKVIESGRELARKHGAEFALVSLAEASEDRAKWKDVLRLAFRQDILSADNELAGWALLAIGTEFPEHGKCIGLEARWALTEGHTKGPGSSETLWLALFAHEFGAMEANELLGVADPYSRQPRLCSINAAIAARLGQRRTTADNDSPVATSVASASLNEVADVMRLDDPTTKGLCDVVVRALYREHEPAEFEQLASVGVEPRLLAAIMQYLYGHRIEVDWLARITETEWTRDRRRDVCREQLRRLALQAFARLRREFPIDARNLLRAEILQRRAGCVFAGVLVTFSGWSLSNDELAAIISEYSLHPYGGWRLALSTIARELVRRIDGEGIDDIVRQSIAQGLGRLVVDHDRSMKDSLAWLLYAAAAWTCGVNNDDAAVAFRIGLSSLVLPNEDGGSDGAPAADALAETLTFLTRVDPKQMRLALATDSDFGADFTAVAWVVGALIRDR